MPLRTLLAPLLLVLPVLAQEESSQRPNPRPQKMPPAIQTPDQAAAGETGDGSLTDGKVVKEKAMVKDGPPAPRSAHGQCHLVSSTQPKRVLPGQGGTILVVMVMEADAVLVAPPPVTFQITPDQGPVHLDQPQFRPAKAASTQLAPAFQGRPVYEDTAIFEVPFSVASNAQFGKHTVGIGLEFDLNQGRTGQLIGRFVDHAAVEVEVGIPTPMAMPSGAPSKPAAPVANAVDDAHPKRGTDRVPAVPKTDSPGNAPDTGPGSLQGTIAQGPVADAPAGPARDADAQDGHAIVSQDGSMLWLAAAGGLLVLALLAIVLARKR